MEKFLENLISWFVSHGLKIFFILFLAFLINRFLQILISKFLKKSLEKLKQKERKKAETLVSVLGGTIRFLVYVIAILMILSELGINIVPILGSLGLLGFAIGLAAKDIISDFISGIFIILEGHYHVGDIVKISGIEGEVKEITLRRTVIIDKNGFLHSIPNSQIKMVSKKIEQK